MTDKTDNPIDRREMGRTALRWILACGIGGAAAVLCVRNGGGKSAGTCGLASCGGCQAIGQCELPQAALARKRAR